MMSSFNSSWDSSGYLEPAWVFSSKTWGSPVLTAHTVAHEVGHTLGLSHDGNASTAYYEGQGNWFPIMGASARGVGQFSKGEYAGANNTQDDLSIIASTGAPYRRDDHSDTISGAESLAGGTAVDGVIGNRLDQDVFAVSPSVRRQPHRACDRDRSGREPGHVGDRAAGRRQRRRGRPTRHRARPRPGRPRPPGWTRP